MTYRALNIAKFVVSKCLSMGKPISNLKLQKMMYYIWIDYYKETKVPLFNEDICAWQLGPVVPEVYYEFCSYAGTPITRKSNIVLSTSDDILVSKIINNYVRISASTLVSRTHRKGGAWDQIYRNGQGVRDVIPFSLIKKTECV